MGRWGKESGGGKHGSCSRRIGGTYSKGIGLPLFQRGETVGGFARTNGGTHYAVQIGCYHVLKGSIAYRGCIPGNDNGSDRKGYTRDLSRKSGSVGWIDKRRKQRAAWTSWADSDAGWVACYLGHAAHLNLVQNGCVLDSTGRMGTITC